MIPKLYSLEQAAVKRKMSCESCNGVHKSSIEMQDVLRKKKKKSKTNT